MLNPNFVFVGALIGAGGSIACLIDTLLTLTGFTFANSAFITYILFVDALIFVLVQFRIGERLGYAGSKGMR